MRDPARLLGPALMMALLCGCQPSVDPAAGDASQRMAAATDPVPGDPVFVCPMDRDIRSHSPGTCPRCGMTLVADIPDPVEYYLGLTVAPPPRANQPVRLAFEIRDPWKDGLVTSFSIVHEKLFHLVIVSRDLQFFEHGHPTWRENAFTYDVAFPRPGLYRLLGDFYPEASTPQLIPKTVIVAGAESPVAPLVRDYAPKQADNLGVALTTLPMQPVAGVPTQLRFTLSPGDGIERYLEIWAHMLAVSDDLIDMMHVHPSLADGGPTMQFNNVVFPRARMYRLWIQVQRLGIVNTAHFDVPVRAEMDRPDQ